METARPIMDLMEELKAGLSDYWKAAAGILQKGGVTLKAPGEDYFSFQKNFFSLLFLYSFQRGGVPRPRRRLYAATLQCLRGMVTGCDNLLDDEYKMTLDTDIPETGVRFRSVIDIMVSDRVLFHLMLDAHRRGEIDLDQVQAAINASMKTMTQSGVQEASEEEGIAGVLAPDDLLQTVHHFKTGLLFQCPWDIPLAMEQYDANLVLPILESLYNIGIGCQIMDDMVDMALDVKQKKHNYLVSLIYHGDNREEKTRLQTLMAEDKSQGIPSVSAELFPAAASKAIGISHRTLEKGLSGLFSPDHHFLVKPASYFLKQRIGAIQPVVAEVQ